MLRRRAWRLSRAGEGAALGLFEGQIGVPDDFDTMFAKEIEEMFYGETAGPDSD